MPKKKKKRDGKMRMYPRNISEEEPIELKPLVNSWGWGKGEFVLSPENMVISPC
jgi:hypothetical protein